MCKAIFLFNDTIFLFIHMTIEINFAMWYPERRLEIRIQKNWVSAINRQRCRDFAVG